MSYSEIKQKLRKHLLSFGIRVFASDEYWTWGGDKLGAKRGERLQALRRPMQECPNKEQLLEFYDYIAHPDVSGVVHSMKADTITVSGVEVESSLPPVGRVLDLGCSIGHLTTFYAS